MTLRPIPNQISQQKHPSGFYQATKHQESNSTNVTMTMSLEDITSQEDLGSMALIHITGSILKEPMILSRSTIRFTFKYNCIKLIPGTLIKTAGTIISIFQLMEIRFMAGI